MIVTGIIIVAIAAVAALLNMLFLFGSAVGDSDTGVIVGVGVHILCAIASVVGVVIALIGVVHALGAH